MTKLLISVSLHSLKEIDHKVLLFLAKNSLLSLILFQHFVLICDSFEVFEFISEVLEVGRSIIVLRGKCRLLHVSVLDELLRSVEFHPGRNGVGLPQCHDLGIVILFQSFNRFKGSLLILCHVIVPSIGELLKLLTLYAFNLHELFSLLLFHSLDLSLQLVVG